MVFSVFLSPLRISSMMNESPPILQKLNLSMFAFLKTMACMFQRCYISSVTEYCFSGEVFSLLNNNFYKNELVE